MIFPRWIPASKRIFDLTVTGVGLLVISPLLILITLLVWFNLGRPILYRQQRPGIKGKPFNIYKFRSMTDAHDPAGNLLPDSERLTGFGRFLRSFSLDEIPELLNVLRGEMSLVGPRPLLMQYLGRYSGEQMRRHDMVPGMTGWAQVNGRNALSWPDKFRLDVWYVDHWTFWLDMKILLLTVGKVFTREGITQAGQTTSEEFMGNSNPEQKPRP